MRPIHSVSWIDAGGYNGTAATYTNFTRVMLVNIPTDSCVRPEFLRYLKRRGPRVGHIKAQRAMAERAGEKALSCQRPCGPLTHRDTSWGKCEMAAGSIIVRLGLLSRYLQGSGWGEKNNVHSDGGAPGVAVRAKESRRRTTE